MARRKMSKSAKIRETFKALGAEARSKDVISALAAKRIKVSAAQVSNVKAGLKDQDKQKRQGSRGRKARNVVAIADLQAANKFVKTLGSLKRAEMALSALAQFR